MQTDPKRDAVFQVVVRDAETDAGDGPEGAPSITKIEQWIDGGIAREGGSAVVIVERVDA